MSSLDPEQLDVPSAVIMCTFPKVLRMSLGHVIAKLEDDAPIKDRIYLFNKTNNFLTRFSIYFFFKKIKKNENRTLNGNDRQYKQPQQQELLC